MAFYDMFELLCTERGISPTRAARDNGLKQQSVSSWKTRGSTPKAETVQKLADYFGVSVDYLLGKVPAGADGTGFGGGTAIGSGFGDSSGYGGPLTERTGAPLSSTDRLVLRKMEGLTEEDKQLVLAMIDRLKRTGVEGSAVMTSRGPYYLYSYPDSAEMPPAPPPAAGEGKEDTPAAEALPEAEEGE